MLLGPSNLFKDQRNKNRINCIYKLFISKWILQFKRQPFSHFFFAFESLLLINYPNCDQNKTFLFHLYNNVSILLYIYFESLHISIFTFYLLFLVVVIYWEVFSAYLSVHLNIGKCMPNVHVFWVNFEGTELNVFVFKHRKLLGRIWFLCQQRSV